MYWKIWNIGKKKSKQSSKYFIKLWWCADYYFAYCLHACKKSRPFWMRPPLAKQFVQKFLWKAWIRDGDVVLSKPRKKKKGKECLNIILLNIIRMKERIKHGWMWTQKKMRQRRAVQGTFLSDSRNICSYSKYVFFFKWSMHWWNWNWCIFLLKKKI